MMLRSWCWIVVLVLTAVPVTGQEGGFRNDELKVDAPSSGDLRLFELMRTGNYPDPATAEDMKADEYQKRLEAPEAKAVITKVVNWMIYRLTWVNVLEQRESSSSEIMEDLLGPARPGGLRPTFAASKLFPSKDKPSDPLAMLRYERQMVFVNAVTPAVVNAAREVLQHQQIICRINGARLLVRLADFGRGEVVEPLLEVITRRDEHDAVRHWAVQGLGELFGQYAAAGAFPNDKGGDRYRKALTVVLEWTETLMNVERPLDDGEQRAVSFMRRHAVRALGNAQRPVIAEAQGNRQGPIASAILLVVDNDARLKPRAHWAERVEAAVALCQLNPKLSPTYQPDFVAYRLANLIAEMGNEALNDPERKKERWRFHAAQLKGGIDRLVTLTEGTPSSAYVKEVATRVQPVLETLDTGKGPESARQLRAWIDGKAPAATSVFK